VQVAMRPRGGVACMGAGCRLRVSEETLRRVGVGQPLLDAWRTALARPFLEATSQGLDTSSSSSSSGSGEGGSTASTGGRSGGGGSSGGPRLVHCQSAACSAVIRVPAASSGAQVVCGECLFRFCALCDFPAPHAPATCAQVAAWQAKGGKVEASAEDMANWLAIKQVEEAAARPALLRACLIVRHSPCSRRAVLKRWPSIEQRRWVGVLVVPAEASSPDSPTPVVIVDVCGAAGRFQSGAPSAGTPSSKKPRPATT
jgi:hypothetical protein